MRETELVAQCLHLLKLRRVFALRLNCGAAMGEYKGRKRLIRFTSVKGVSDILAVLPLWAGPGEGGKLLALEVKVGSNRLTPDQEAFQWRVRDCGAYAVTVRSLAELEDVLKELGV